MNQEQSWDWSTPIKQIPLHEWDSRFNWVEDFHISPDGESIAAVVNLDEAIFSVCANGVIWDEAYEKVWGLKALSNGQFAAMVCNDEAWTVSNNGKEWEEKFDFVWDLRTSQGGSHIGVAIQKDGKYAMAVDDNSWTNFFDNISGMTLSGDGSSAAIVQVKPMAAADINAFKNGIFSCAVNGRPLNNCYQNIWDINFDSTGENITYAIRLNREAYTIVQEDQPWDTNFQCVWHPLFIEGKLDVVAPVRVNGKWQLYKNGNPFWKSQYNQIWNLKSSPKPDNLAAIVSHQFGKWTISENDSPWPIQIDSMIPDLFYSKDGSMIAAPAKHKGTWGLIANQQYWDLKADKIYDPVISESGKVVAVVIEKGGEWFLAINNKIVSTGYDFMTAPAINPDESKVMLKGVKESMYTRQILSVDTFF